MSLVTIPPNFGALFGGFATLLLVCFVIYIGWQWWKFVRVSFETDMKFSILESVMLSRTANKRNIDLDKEMVKRELFQRQTFRKKIEKEILEDFFEEKKKGND